MDKCVPGSSDLSSLSLPEEAGSVRKSKGTVVEEELEILGTADGLGQIAGRGQCGCGVRRMDAVLQLRLFLWERPGLTPPGGRPTHSLLGLNHVPSKSVC